MVLKFELLINAASHGSCTNRTASDLYFGQPIREYCHATEAF